MNETELVTESNTKFIFKVITDITTLKDDNDDVLVEIAIENKYFKYSRKEDFFRKKELLDLSNRIKNNYYYRYTEEQIVFINPNFKLLLWGKEEQQYLEIQLYIDKTTDFYNLSLSPEESKEFVKMIDLQTKR